MTRHDHSRERTSMLVLFMINVVIAFIYTIFADVNDLFDYVVGIFVGLILLSLFEREYGRRAFRLIYFVFYVAWAILVSNVELAWIILQPGARMNRRLDPGIVAIPLDVSTGLEITILASIITLTPGTLSVDLGDGADGTEVLYVHSLRVRDPAAFRATIKQNFERQILGFTREQVPS